MALPNYSEALFREDLVPLQFNGLCEPEQGEDFDCNS